MFLCFCTRKLHQSTRSLNLYVYFLHLVPTFTPQRNPPFSIILTFPPPPSSAGQPSTVTFALCCCCSGSERKAACTPRAAHTPVHVKGRTSTTLYGDVAMVIRCRFSWQPIVSHIYGCHDNLCTSLTCLCNQVVATGMANGW